MLPDNAATQSRDNVNNQYCMLDGKQYNIPMTSHFLRARIYDLEEIKNVKFMNTDK